jgi:ubiquinone/menaquinone biosynthesis C-methylase UbiE
MESVVSWILLILLVIASIQYVYQIIQDRVTPQLIGPNAFPQREGFTDGPSTTSGSESKEVFLNNEQLYDSFYAKVYDQLTQNTSRTQAKVTMILSKWKQQGTPPEQMTVADIGCGTGVASMALVKGGVKQVVGVDRSIAMLQQAQQYLDEEKKLTAEGKKRISWKQADVQSPSALGGGEVTHAVVLYFSLYYLPDKESFFRNMFLWVQPGGQMAVEVVNKYKFDPMLEASAPWLGFSLQKYSKDRITESKVVFDKFDYTGKFDLTDPAAEFRETFRFKDGSIRRQRHLFHMPTIEEIVKSAQVAGWRYTQYFDLTTIGFEYAYILLFRHP